LLDGQGHEGQVVSVVLARSRQVLNEGGAGLFALQKMALVFGYEIHHAKEVGLWVAVEHLLQHAF
jgi:hypothetical protein